LDDGSEDASSSAAAVAPIAEQIICTKLEKKSKPMVTLGKIDFLTNLKLIKKEKKIEQINYLGNTTKVGEILTRDDISDGTTTRAVSASNGTTHGFRFRLKPALAIALEIQSS
jgi:hypothetical protein